MDGTITAASKEQKVHCVHNCLIMEDSTSWKKEVIVCLNVNAGK